jgi:hypothetical protein
MGEISEIVTEGRSYRRNRSVDRFQIPLNELGNLRMADIPPRTHVEILGLPEPRGIYNVEYYGLNVGNQHELSVYGGASFKVAISDRERMMSRLYRAFPHLDPKADGTFRSPEIMSESEGAEAVVRFFFNRIFTNAPDITLREAMAPIVDGLRRLERPNVHAFLCHASEDKPAARDLANALIKCGAEVWLDEWEIRVGDSIVQKIDGALGTVSHLIILLSNNSVDKPWVRKELSSALMRQLSQNAIKVLPVRLDDCTIPPILADIKICGCSPRSGECARRTRTGPFRIF